LPLPGGGSLRSISDEQWKRSWIAIGVVLGLAFIWWTLDAAGYDVGQELHYAVAGLGSGAAAALAGVGLTLTYRATGVFNFAFGAIATFVAYVIWQFVVSFGFPQYITTAVAVLLIGPVIGLALERFPFRPLQRRGASTSEKLLATIAVFAVIIGVVVVIWTLASHDDDPTIWPAAAFHLGGFVVSLATIGNFLIVVVLAGGLTALLRFTSLGTKIRAVVDRRELAELTGIRANRVAAVSWAIGCGFAGLAGALYAPAQGLSPYGVTLFIFQTFGVAAIARLTSLGLAVVGGFAIGVISSMGFLVEPQITAFWPGLRYIQPYLFAVALPIFLLIYRNLDELGGGNSAAGIVASSVGRLRRRNRRVLPGAAVAIVIVGVGFLLSGSAMSAAQQIVAVTIIFLSIVAITGFSGHITLGQAGFAGLAALLSTKLANGAIPYVPSIPVIPAMIIAALVVVVLGVLAGFPALRRKGLILGLSTLAVGLLLYYLMFQNFYFLDGVSDSPRPSIFGLSLTGDTAFYLYELVVLAFALVFTSSLRSGRLGRILGAMRDSEAGATSVGISLRRYKLFIFAASAFLAGIGGSLLAQQQQTWDAQSYSPLISLFWFLAVVFAGLSYLSGAAIGALLYVGLDFAIGRSNASIVVIGVLSLVTISALRGGGLVGAVLRLAGGRSWVPRGLQQRYLDSLGAEQDALGERVATQTGLPVGPPVEQPAYAASPFARKLLQEAKR
jgi:branched-chain amino acid transport system permease protein